MKMISYWKGIDGQPEPLEIYEDKEGLVFIIGTYDHKNQNKAEKALGIHWGDYPQSRGILAPCVIPAETRSAILAGLLHQAINKQDMKAINRISDAINFFIN